MNEKEKAYCKHNLNLMRKAKVNSAFGMMCDELVVSDELLSDLSEKMLDIMLGTKYTFNTNKSELEEYSEQMKELREYYGTEFPAEEYSADGKILYTESLFDTLKDFGFAKIAINCGSYNCVALNGFDGSYTDGSVLQIGKIVYDDEDYCCYFKGSSFLSILQESWGYLTATNEEAKIRAFKLANVEYRNLIEEEKELAKYMASLGVYAIIQI